MLCKIECSRCVVSKHNIIYQPVVVAELLQWTESQVRARRLWAMPAPLMQARTPAHNPVPVKRDIPKQFPILVKVCNVLYIPVLTTFLYNSMSLIHWKKWRWSQRHGT